MQPGSDQNQPNGTCTRRETEQSENSRPFLATRDNESIAQRGVHGKHGPVVRSGHNSAQHVIFPHTDIPTDGTCKRQVILKRSGEGGDTLIKRPRRVQNSRALPGCTPRMQGQEGPRTCLGRRGRKLEAPSGPFLLHGSNPGHAFPSRSNMC